MLDEEPRLGPHQQVRTGEVDLAGLAEALVRPRAVTRHHRVDLPDGHRHGQRPDQARRASRTPSWIEATSRSICSARSARIVTRHL